MAIIKLNKKVVGSKKGLPGAQIYSDDKTKTNVFHINCDGKPIVKYDKVYHTICACENCGQEFFFKKSSPNLEIWPNFYIIEEESVDTSQLEPVYRLQTIQSGKVAYTASVALTDEELLKYYGYI